MGEGVGGGQNVSALLGEDMPCDGGGGGASGRCSYETLTQKWSIVKKLRCSHNSRCLKCLSYTNGDSVKC